MDVTVEMWGISIRSGRAKLGCCRRRHIHRAFHFLVDSTSSFRQLFGNELGTKTVYREDLEVQVPLPLRADRSGLSNRSPTPQCRRFKRNSWRSSRWRSREGFPCTHACHDSDVTRGTRETEKQSTPRCVSCSLSLALSRVRRISKCTESSW